LFRVSYPGPSIEDSGVFAETRWVAYPSRPQIGEELSSRRRYREVNHKEIHDRQIFSSCLEENKIILLVLYLRSSIQSLSRW